jgi:hypothetical protein
LFITKHCPTPTYIDVEGDKKQKKMKSKKQGEKHQQSREAKRPIA